MLVAAGAGVVRSSGFFFQAEDGIRDLVRSRGLGDVYKRQDVPFCQFVSSELFNITSGTGRGGLLHYYFTLPMNLSLIHI